MKRIILVFACLCLVCPAGAQKVHYTVSDYAHKPVWIEMIKDTSVNFFEAQKAFDTYFQHHEKPEGEHDVIGERDAREKYPSKKKQRKVNADNAMRMEVKKYEHWHDRVLPYVQEDGHILSPAERLKIWSEQKASK